MASFKTILDDIGSVLKKVFTAGVTIAEDAEPIVAVAYPGLVALYNATVLEVSKAEGLALAAGSQAGTGVQKLALVVQAITTEFNSYASANGLGIPALQTIENYVNAVVASLNAIPAATLSTSGS